MQRQVAGLPVRLPMVDIHTVSAGRRLDRAGSTAAARCASARRARVPTPGPGVLRPRRHRPTVTDANLVLGRLPAGVADRRPTGARRRRARRRRSGSLGVGTAEEAAAGDRRSRRQRDGAGAARGVGGARPRPGGRLRLLAVGGAGPLHACELRDPGLGAARVLCLPGQRRALRGRPGGRRAPPRQRRRRTWLQPLDEAPGPGARGRPSLAGATDGEDVRGAADLRYAGQIVRAAGAVRGPVRELQGGLRTPSTSARYGHADRDRAIELVTLRAAAVAPGADVTLARHGRGRAPAARADIRWDGADVEAETVLSGTGLPPGTKVAGPAIVEFPGDALPRPARPGPARPTTTASWRWTAT